MIARGTAALFAHLVHYRQFRFLWAISPTGDKCGMGSQQREALWLPPPQNESRCWTAIGIILLLVFLTGTSMEMCYAFSAFNIPRGCPIHLNHRGRGWEDCPKALALDSALPSVFLWWESIDLPALPWMLPKRMSFCSSIICSCCRSGFQLLSPATFEQLSNWFTG